MDQSNNQSRIITSEETERMMKEEEVETDQHFFPFHGSSRKPAALAPLHLMSWAHGGIGVQRPSRLGDYRGNDPFRVQHPPPQPATCLHKLLNHGHVEWQKLENIGTFPCGTNPCFLRVPQSPHQLPASWCRGKVLKIAGLGRRRHVWVKVWSINGLTPGVEMVIMGYNERDVRG